MAKKFEIIIGKPYEWETFVYVMKSNDGCKFGITNNMERRLKKYEISNPELKLKYCKLFNNRNIARLIEFKMKNYFPIIKGYETTDAPLNDLISYIENSKNDLKELILELPEHLILKNIPYENLIKNTKL